MCYNRHTTKHGILCLLEVECYLNDIVQQLVNHTRQIPLKTFSIAYGGHNFPICFYCICKVFVGLLLI